MHFVSILCFALALFLSPVVTFGQQSNLFDISKIEPRDRVGELTAYLIERVGEKITVKFEEKISLTGNREFKYIAADYCMNGLDQDSKNKLPWPSDVPFYDSINVCIENQQSENAFAAGGALSRLPEHITRATVIFDQVTIVKSERDIMYYARFFDLGEEEKKLAAIEDKRREKEERERLTDTYERDHISLKDGKLIAWIEERREPNPNQYPSKETLLYSYNIVVSEKDKRRVYNVTDRRPQRKNTLQLLRFDKGGKNIFFNWRESLQDARDVDDSIPPRNLSILDLKTGSVKILWDKGGSHGNFIISRNDRFIALVLNPKDCNSKTSITILDTKTKKTFSIKSSLKNRCINGPTFSPDSKVIGYTLSAKDSKQKTSFITSVDSRRNIRVVTNLNLVVEGWLPDSRLLLRESDDFRNAVRYSVNKQGKGLRNESKRMKTFSDKKLGITFRYPSYMPIEAWEHEGPLAHPNQGLWSIGIDEKGTDFEFNTYYLQMTGYHNTGDMSYEDIKARLEFPLISTQRKMIINGNKVLLFDEDGMYSSATAYIFGPTQTIEFISRFDDTKGRAFNDILKTISLSK